MSEDPHHSPPLKTDSPDSFARLVAWLRVRIGYSAQQDDDASDLLLADQARRWTSRSIMIAVVLLAVFNSQSLVSWASTLPPDWGSGTLRELSRVWETRLDEAGLTQVFKTIHDRYQDLKSLHWP
jgi:hypothetical protein